MHPRTGSNVVSCGIVVLALGCGGGAPTFQRIGPAYPLTLATPRSACERDEWYELAPAAVVTRRVAGIGIYRTARQDPEDLEDLLPSIDEPELARNHQARIDRVDALKRRASRWTSGALLALGGGIAIGAVIDDESHPTAQAVALSGLLISLVAFEVADQLRRSADDQGFGEARRRLFVLGEDDITAAARAVNKLNARRRGECGGESVPSETGPGQQASPHR